MIIIDLRKEKYTIDELLTLSTSETLMIYDKDGKHYILEETDNFEEEVEKLGNSEKFLKFLNARSKENTLPISSIANRLGIRIKDA